MNTVGSREHGPSHLALAIKTRRTLSVATGDTLALSVTCPVRGRDVSLDACLACDHCHGLCDDPGGRGAAVACDADEELVAGTVASSEPPPADSSVARGAANRTPISAVMTKHVVCVREDLSLDALRTMLVEVGISGVPVVNEDGHAVGMVSKTDLVREQHEASKRGEMEGVRALKVGDIMMPVAFTLPANESIARAAALMAFEGVHRLPVVGALGQIVGLVSPLDVLRWLAREHGYVLADQSRDGK